MPESDENRYQHQNRFVKLYRWLHYKPWYALTALYRFIFVEDDTCWLEFKTIWSIHMGLADSKMKHLYDDAEINLKRP